MTRRWTTLTLTALACATVASAQTSSTAGAVRGTVRNKAGQAVANASLSLRNRETGLVRTATTSAQGEYHIGLLPVGSYELTVTAAGMRTLKDTSVQVSLGQNAIANFSLDTAEASAMVEIVASSQSLDTTQVNSITAVDQKLVETIPINGRNFTDLALLTPGATDAQDNRVSMDGARGIQNNLTIDGASFNSSFFGEQRGSTRIPFAFGADTIKELQVISNAYDAQYGNAAGAVINAVSKTGTNEFSGSALYQVRPESTVAKIRPVPYDRNGTTNSEQARTKKFSQYNLNLNVGGPIIKDKLHYFAGVETYRYKEDYTSVFPVSATPGNTAADLTNFLNALGNRLVVGSDGRTFAQENGRGYSNERENTVFFGRLDWTISPDHRATFRVNSQNWKSENGTTTGTSTLTTGESNNGLEENRSLSWVAELNSTLSSSLFNEARLQFATERRPRTPNSTASSEISVGGFRAGQNEFLPNGLDEFATQFIDNLTWVKDDWTFKAGVDLQDFTYRNSFFRRQGGQWSFGNYLAAYQWAQGATGNLVYNATTNPIGSVNYQQGVSDTDGRIDFGGQLQAFYAQAQYAGLLNKRLNLTLGLRHTRESWDDNPNPNPALQGLDKAANSSATDPRFGFSLDLFGNGKSILRGGYGWFSSGNPALTVSNTMLGNGNGVRNYFVSLGTATRTQFQTGILSQGQRITADNRLVRVDPALMSSTFSAGTIVAQLWDPENKMPQARRMSLGYEQDMGQMWSGLVVGARVAYAQFRNLQYFTNVNLRQRLADGTPDPNGYYNDGYPTTLNTFTTTGRPGFAIIRGRRVDLSAFGNVNLSLNDGEGTYKALVLEARRFSDTGFGFTTNLTFSKAEDNNSNERTTSGSTSNTSNPADPLALVAPSDNDRKFRGVFAGYFPLYFGIRGSVYFTYASGRPYSAYDTRDLNSDGLTGNDLAVGLDGRNGYRQPHMKKLDLRLTRSFQITSRFNLEANIDVFNVMNWANQTTSLYSAVSGSGPIADFGYINTPDRDTRDVQFSIRARF